MKEFDLQANVTYRYSELDKQYEFGILAHTWVWFHLGSRMCREGIEERIHFLQLFPYVLKDKDRESKIIRAKEADKVAQKIVDYIKSKIK